MQQFGRCWRESGRYATIVIWSLVIPSGHPDPAWAAIWQVPEPFQVSRIEGGKLAETWLMLQPLGSAWTDTLAQEHWTSPPPIK
jgi:hypothetical protein